jgi:uncharacterized protein with HEPN domain
MPHEIRDPAFILDMLDSARSVIKMTEAVPFDRFVSNRQLYRAVEREIEIIGEAANRVSKELTLAHPEVPWSKIIGTRHRLAHEYGEIQLAIIFRIATIHIAELIPQLEKILAELPPVPMGD